MVLMYFSEDAASLRMRKRESDYKIQYRHAQAVKDFDSTSKINK